MGTTATAAAAQHSANSISAAADATLASPASFSNTNNSPALSLPQSVAISSKHLPLDHHQSQQQRSQQNFRSNSLCSSPAAISLLRNSNELGGFVSAFCSSSSSTSPASSFCPTVSSSSVSSSNSLSPPPSPHSSSIFSSFCSAHVIDSLASVLPDISSVDCMNTMSIVGCMAGQQMPSSTSSGNGAGSQPGSLSNSSSGQSTPAQLSAPMSLGPLGSALGNSLVGNHSTSHQSSSSSGSNSASQTPSALDLGTGFTFPTLSSLQQTQQNSSSNCGTPVPGSLSSMQGSSLSPDCISNVLSNAMNNALSSGLGSSLSNPLSSSLTAGLSTSLSNGMGNGLGNGMSNGLSNGLHSNGMSNVMSNGLSNGLSVSLSNGMSLGNGLSGLSLASSLGNGSINNSFIKCSLCGLSYQEPKVMPCCLRSYCSGCLDKLQQQQTLGAGQANNVLKCPGCAHELQLPENGVSGLMTDFSLVKLMQQLNDPNLSISSNEPTCAMHRDQALRYFCRTCEQPMCKDCLAFQHQKHEHEYLLDASKKFVEQLYSMLNEGKTKCGQLNVTLKTIEHCSSKLQVQYSKAQNDIQETYLFYLQQLDQQRALQLKELEDSYNTKLLTLSLLNSKVHDSIDKINQMSLFLERFNKFNCSFELLQFKQLLESRLKQIKHFEPEMNLPKVDLEFVNNYQAIQGTVKQNFGYLRNTDSSKQPPISRPACGLLNYQSHSFDSQLMSGSGVSGQKLNGDSNNHNGSSSGSSCSPGSNSSSLMNGPPSLNGLVAAINSLGASSTGACATDGGMAPLYEKWSIGCGSGGSPDSGLFTNGNSLSDPLMELGGGKLTSLAGSLSSALVSQQVLSSSQTSQQQSLPIKSQVKRQKMIYHCKFGEFGIMEGQFTEPSGVAVNAQNDIIVADTNNHRIQIFDKEGRFKFQFGECGKRDGQLLYPNRVAVVKQSGDIIVTERSPTHQIQIYNQYGQFVRKFGANILQHPRGVTVDNKGRIIVVECKVMRVLIFDQMGNVLQKFGCSKHLEFPNGVVVNDRQEIFISDNRAHCVKVFSYEGHFLRQIGGEGLTNYPIGVCINESGEILVADNHNNFNITIFTQSGQLLNALESRVKHAQCFDVALMDDNSVVLASKDYKIYIYRYLQLQSLAQAVATSGLC